MRPFGYTRRDKLECPYGCCTLKGGKDLNCRYWNDKAARKRGRREAVIECKEEIREAFSLEQE